MLQFQNELGLTISFHQDAAHLLSQKQEEPM
jgi:hypothetical protein